MKILIVEDELRLRRSLERAFREQGYVADSAASGEEGLFKALNYCYDAILLDVILPVADGWQILERLRKENRTPVLMLTGRGEPADRVRGLDLGADDYLTKPFDLAELLARVRALTRRSTGHALSFIDLDDEVSIDTRSRVAVKSGRIFQLTAREYSILEYLALHRGKVVSRTELFEHLVDENDDSCSNSMDVHVFAIRRKLGPGLIKTRRGQGYWIE
jgi:two-component system OmpR family response regulator